MACMDGAGRKGPRTHFWLPRPVLIERAVDNDLIYQFSRNFFKFKMSFKFIEYIFITKNDDQPGIADFEEIIIFDTEWHIWTYAYGRALEPISALRDLS